MRPLRDGGINRPVERLEGVRESLGVTAGVVGRGVRLEQRRIPKQHLDPPFPMLDVVLVARERFDRADRHLPGLVHRVQVGEDRRDSRSRDEPVRSSQCVPMSATARSSPPCSGSRRQFQSAAPIRVILGEPNPVGRASQRRDLMLREEPPACFTACGPEST